MREANTPGKVTSPLKATRWRKRGFIIPKDSDGAYRASDRKDGRIVISSEVQTQLKEAS